LPVKKKAGKNKKDVPTPAAETPPFNMEEPLPYPEATPVVDALIKVVYIKKSTFTTGMVIPDLLKAISKGNIFYFIIVFINEISLSIPILP
jgi:hypothetical protein